MPNLETLMLAEELALSKLHAARFARRNGKMSDDEFIAIRDLAEAASSAYSAASDANPSDSFARGNA